MYNVSLTYYNECMKLSVFDEPVFSSKKDKAALAPTDRYRESDYQEVPFSDEDGTPSKGRCVRDFNITSFEEKAREEAARAEHSVYNSMARTKSNIKSLALSFKPAWFCTFTFSPEKVDRYNYDEVSKYMQKYLAILDNDIKYIVVPELHKDGAYHFHGLFSDMPMEFAGKYRNRKSGAYEEVYHVPGFTLGFTQCTKIKSSYYAALYISKYITKNLCAVSKGKKRYWRSRSIPDAPVFKFLLKDAAKSDIIEFIESFKKLGGYYAKDAYRKVNVFYISTEEGLSVQDISALADAVFFDDAFFYL